MTQSLISTVTPVFRGEETLCKLVALLEKERESWIQKGLPIELTEAIFVVDDAADGSPRVLAEISDRLPWVRVLTLSRNFGQHPATVAGILHSSGDWVATLDEDLQHDPREILGLLRRAVEKSSDIVYAQAAGAVHGSVLRDQGSRLFKALLAFLTNDPQVRAFNSFRMIRGSVARAAASVTSHDTYFDIALGWFTKRVETLEMKLEDLRFQKETQSGYSLRTLLSHARRMLVSAQTKWLRVGTTIGIAALALGAILAIYVLVVRIVSPGSIEVRGWLSLFLAVVFFGGLSSLLLGIVLEYMSTIVLKAQGKPSFFVVDRSQDELLRELLVDQSPRGHSKTAEE